MEFNNDFEKEFIRYFIDIKLHIKENFLKNENFEVRFHLMELIVNENNNNGHINQSYNL